MPVSNGKFKCDLRCLRNVLSTLLINKAVSICMEFGSQDNSVSVWLRFTSAYFHYLAY